jgi:hypothetical protein
MVVSLSYSQVILDQSISNIYKNKGGYLNKQYIQDKGAYLKAFRPILIKAKNIKISMLVNRNRCTHVSLLPQASQI